MIQGDKNMDIERFNNVYKEETNKISNKRQYAAEIFIGVLQFWHKTILKQIDKITDEYLDNTIAECIKKILTQKHLNYIKL